MTKSPEKSAEKPTEFNLTAAATLSSERGSVSHSAPAGDAKYRKFPHPNVNGRAAGHRPALRFGFGLAVGFTLAFSTLLPFANAAPLKTQNVFLIISDGFRWQEVFNGAEADLMTKENGGVEDTNALRSAFWRATPQERREA